MLFVGVIVAILPSELSVTVALTGVVVPSLTSVKVEAVSETGEIASEKVAVTLVLRATPLAPLVGLVAVTVRGETSGVSPRRAWRRSCALRWLPYRRAGCFR